MYGKKVILMLRWKRNLTVKASTVKSFELRVKS